MNTLTILTIALIVSKVLLIVVVYFLWRTNTRLKEMNRTIFLLKRRGIVNEKELDELRKTAKR